MNIFAGLPDVLESLAKGVLPLLALFLVFQFAFLRLPRAYLAGTLKGVALAVAGLVLFMQGVNIGLLPVGSALGEALGGLPYKWLLIPCGFVFGALAAYSEPAVRVLAQQVEQASSGAVRRKLVLYSITLGVASFAALGMARIVYAIPLLYILVPSYLLVILAVFASDRNYISVAFDAGAVATGPMVMVLLTAVAVGVAGMLDGPEAATYGLGMVGLIGLAPILAVLLLGLLYRLAARRS